MGLLRVFDVPTGDLAVFYCERSVTTAVIYVAGDRLKSFQLFGLASAAVVMILSEKKKKQEPIFAQLDAEDADFGVGNRSAFEGDALGSGIGLW